MRYDSATHTARAALLAEGAAMATSPRLRIKLLAHAVIAKGLAKLAEEDGSCVCMFIAGSGCLLDNQTLTSRRH